MIEKDEILKMASSLSLTPDTIEKDYVLSWLLFGIHQHNEISKDWAFKGGTSLKKCFFETFRFSEDLDFTVRNQNYLSEEFLKKTFDQITDSLYEEIGIKFFKENFKFKSFPRKNDKLYVQGKLYYNGPLRKKQKFGSIKLDLTTDEVLVLDSQAKRIHHPYSDEPVEGLYTHCYAFEEVVAEKVRALAERLRPRDVYDVVHFFRNRSMVENPQLVFNVLIKKCSYKQIKVPDFEFIKTHKKSEELEAQWKNMLNHQLPSLPPLESFWRDIEPFFDWLNGSLQEERLVGPVIDDSVTFQPGRISNADSINAILEKIKFSAASRVCVTLLYYDKERTIEPLSFRKTGNGNKLFYGYERESSQTKVFSLSKIQDVAITNLPYIEKYPVEINATGKITMPPVRR